MYICVLPSSTIHLTVSTVLTSYFTSVVYLCPLYLIYLIYLFLSYDNLKYLSYPIIPYVYHHVLPYLILSYYASFYESTNFLSTYPSLSIHLSLSHPVYLIVSIYLSIYIPASCLIQFSNLLLSNLVLSCLEHLPVYLSLL